jgi:starvation-inducible outer membrane lipoprotein
VRITSGLDITHTLLRSTAAPKITRAERRPAARRSVTDHPEDKIVVAHSARNRFGGLVIRVVRDTMMAQVEIQTGPHGSCRCSAAKPPTSSAWSQGC